ncbi:MAG TPA: DUF6789 family protein [Steroidobacteraceae bacterium]|nr:DUF6789 family protein [Steroidobacteraceae bacterium]
MNRYLAGPIAGLIATLVLSTLMIINAGAGLMPQLDVIGSLASLLESNRIVAWWVHVAIGTFAWGLGFAIAERWLPGRHYVKGMVFATGAWIAMMLLVMPLAGAGFFGLSIGLIVPVATLVLHLVFGATLGSAYRALLRRPAATEPGPRHLEPSADPNRPSATRERFEKPAHHRH